jgi:hypothetical protein
MQIGFAMNRRRKCEAVFFASYGLGPWECVFCGAAIKIDDESPRTRLHIHHCDEDKDNNTKENLSPTHASCHIRHHHQGITKPHMLEAGKRVHKIGIKFAHTPEANAKRSASLRRWHKEHPEESAENNRKRAEKCRGQKRTPEQRARMSAAAKTRRKK